MSLRRRRGMVAAFVSLGFTLMAAAVLLLAPLGTRQDAVATSPAGGQFVTRVENVSLLEHEGPTVLIPLSVPVAVALLGTVASPFRRPKIHRTVSAGLLVAFVILGAMSIGVFYLPSAIAMGVAAARTDGAGAPARQSEQR